MIAKLKKYIADNFITETNYAKHKGFSVAHINAITLGKKEPTRDILMDIGLEKVINKKVSYVLCAKNLNG